MFFKDLGLPQLMMLIEKLQYLPIYVLLMNHYGDGIYSEDLDNNEVLIKNRFLRIDHHGLLFPWFKKSWPNPLGDRIVISQGDQFRKLIRRTVEVAAYICLKFLNLTDDETFKFFAFSQIVISNIMLMLRV